MKLKSLSPVFTAIAIALAGLTTAKPGQTVPAPGQSGFWCDTSSGIPTTMYQNRQGGREPWIRWVSNAFAASGYNPMTRCLEVSGRLETYRRNKQLKFITVGIMNRERVVCTASQINGRCEGLIFTLKPNQDAVRTLNNLLAWREGQAGTPSLYESGATPYIDVRARLGEDAPTNTVPPTAPSPSQPTAQPSSGQMREL